MQKSQNPEQSYILRHDCFPLLKMPTLNRVEEEEDGEILEA